MPNEVPNFLTSLLTIPQFCIQLKTSKMKENLILFSVITLSVTVAIVAANAINKKVLGM